MVSSGPPGLPQACHGAGTSQEHSLQTPRCEDRGLTSPLKATWSLPQWRAQQVNTGHPPPAALQHGKGFWKDLSELCRQQRSRGSLQVASSSPQLAR